MASWPTTLPSPKLSGYKLTPLDQVIRTDMEGGNTRTRRRTTARVDKFAVAFDFNETQMAAFRAWYELDTGADGGNAWFTIAIPTGYGGVSSVSAKMTLAGADFIGRGAWIVSGQFEVRYA